MSFGGMMHFQRNRDGSLTLRTEVEVHIPAGTSMLEAEEALMIAVNKAGESHGRASQAMDADGSDPARQADMGGQAGEEVRHVETPWLRGGSPLGLSMLRQRRLLSHGSGGGHRRRHAQVPRWSAASSWNFLRYRRGDLRGSHARSVSADFVRRRVSWFPCWPERSRREQAEVCRAHEVATISVGVDSAAMLMGARRDDATAADARTERTREWRMTTVGTITLHNHAGERVGTIYAATAPPEDKEEGKAAIWEVMNRELAALKARYPRARYTGLSDGAADLLPWLRANTSRVTLDFYHASGYVCAAAGAFAHERPRGAEEDWWAQQACHHLRHEEGGAAGLLAVMEECLTDARRLRAPDREALEKAVTYFRNNVGRMDYAACAAEGLPIGSGVTEAGCKLIVKKRFCGPGMTWSFRMAGHLLKLRAAAKSAGERWKDLWRQILTNNAAL
jgi:hypothetical protein